MDDAARNRLLKSLSPQDKQGYDRVNGLIQTVSKQNPGLKVDALEDYRDTMLQAMLKTQSALDAKIKEGERKHQPFTKQQQQGFVNEASIRARNEWMETRLPRYDEDGKKAWGAFQEEANKSVGSGIVSNVYDKSQGGVQWGGVAGALVGGLLLSTLAGGTGTWFGIIAIVVGALLGSWVGDMAGDTVRNKMNANQTEKSDTPAQGKGKEHQQMVDPEAMERAKQAVLDGSTPETPPEQEPSETNLPPAQGTPAPAKKPAPGKGKGG